MCEQSVSLILLGIFVIFFLKLSFPFYYFFKNFRQCTLITLYSYSWLLPYLPSFLPPPNLCFIFLIVYWSQFVLRLYSWMWRGGGSLEHRKHTIDHKVKENWLSSAKMPSTEIVSQLGIGAGQLPFFIPEVSLFCSCVGNHSFWQFMSTAVLSFPKYIVLLWSSPICVS